MCERERDKMRSQKVKREGMWKRREEKKEKNKMRYERERERERERDGSNQVGSTLF